MKKLKVLLDEETIAKRVREKGMGFLMIGGHATLAGTEGNGAEAANGWRGINLAK